MKMEETPRRNVDREPKVVITLPLFNEFGIAKHLEDEQLDIMDLKDSFSMLFVSAKETIYICSPFLEYEGIEPYVNILLEKGIEGVKIYILAREIGSKNPSKRRDGIKQIYDMFQERGVNFQIRNYHFTYANKVASSIHAKMIIVDNRLAYVGSGELRRNSLERNFEVGLIVEGKTAQNLAKIFEEIFDISEDFIGVNK